MSNVTIIGSGRMARGLATALLRGNQPVQILGRDGARTRTLVESLGPGATGGIIGVPATGALSSWQFPMAKSEMPFRRPAEPLMEGSSSTSVTRWTSRRLTV